MKTILKMAVLCLGLGLATPSFSQVNVDLQLGHRHHHRTVIYSQGTYRHYYTAPGVSFRHEYGPGYERHTRYIHDENGNVIHSREVTRDANGNLINRRTMTRDANGNVIRRTEESTP